MRWLLIALCASCGRIAFEGAPSVGRDGDTGADSGPEPSGLLLHFEFEPGELLVDRARGHDATCVACPTLATDPQRGSVALFDGATQCLNIADAPELRPAQFTVTAWIQRRGTGGGGAAFVRPRDAASFEEAIEIYMAGANASWGVNQTFVNSSAVAADLWHHVAGTYDGTSALLYINGIQVESGAASTVTYVAGDATHIGCDFDFGNDLDWWDGWLDSVRFYDRPLSASEIMTVMAR